LKDLDCEQVEMGRKFGKLGNEAVKEDILGGYKESQNGQLT